MRQRRYGPRSSTSKTHCTRIHHRRATDAFYDFFLDAIAQAASAQPVVVNVPFVDNAQRAMIDAVLAGRGVTTAAAPFLAQSTLPEQLISLPFEPPLHAPIVLIAPQTPNPVVHLLTDFLVPATTPAGGPSE